ncbi:uncharacterized protein (DUF1501 family) [Nocardioides marinisabuli]|uniref:Uncharacterized protein (DUF1501 family) n=1 Tax=Nocardioides marinisabuli TaxID=419476 RepID=A0A7Y9EYE2_9ACTN|nr:DUF1501 domain-containing protein [Nocardioides marinisabuli]NYD56263.1 uncharacterized protein (DUF1501 family) [Nocardioides marinisabuli]
MSTPELTAPTGSGASCGCAEYAAVSRRGLLRGMGAAALTWSVGSAVVSAAGPALAATTTSTATDGSVVVVLSLRGAADGLSLVVPHGDPAYYAARPRIAVPAEKLLVPDGFFGLHPSLAPLLPLWRAGRLAGVHGTGLPVVNRSHFAAMEAVEDAAPGSTERVGWLNRLLGELPGSSPLQGLAAGRAEVPTSLFGPEPVMGFRSLERTRIAGDDKWDPNGTRVRSLERMWKRSSDPMGRAFRSAMAAVDDLEPARAQADRSAAYPDDDLGRALASVARTLRGDVGVSLVTVDHGDWDMHTDLGTLGWGRMRREAESLASGIAAFFDDLGSVADRVTLVTVSEFGRRVAENANHGLDHGWGTVMLLAGAGVRGGYHGSWTPLGTSLDADVPVTTDYRSVLAEVVAARTPASPTVVFPGFQRERVGAMLGQ